MNHTTGRTNVMDLLMYVDTAVRRVDHAQNHGVGVDDGNDLNGM